MAVIHRVIRSGSIFNHPAGGLHVSKCIRAKFVKKRQIYPYTRTPRSLLITIELRGDCQLVGGEKKSSVRFRVYAIDDERCRKSVGTRKVARERRCALHIIPRVANLRRNDRRRNKAVARQCARVYNILIMYTHTRGASCAPAERCSGSGSAADK